jgi:hypothetical protein
MEHAPVVELIHRSYDLRLHLRRPTKQELRVEPFVILVEAEQD